MDTRISRRAFLRQTCAAGAVLAAAGTVGGLFPLNALASGGTQQQSRLLMGTIVTLTAATGDAARAEDAFAAAFAEMERLIAVFDRRASASALGVLNSLGSLRDAPVELSEVLAASTRMSRFSDSAFNPAITPVVDLFDKTRGVRLPGYTDADLREALALAKPGEIRLSGGSVRLGREGMTLTLDGIAKGYIADRASAVLAGLGLGNHMVNAGGDIRCMGRSASGEPWNVGIQHPEKAGALLAAVPVTNKGIATSGSYEKAYDRARTRHHLISHLTGKSADAASVTVLAGTAMEADALATALALLPPAQAMRLADESGAACLYVDRLGRRRASSLWG